MENLLLFIDGGDFRIRIPILTLIDLELTGGEGDQQDEQRYSQVYNSPQMSAAMASHCRVSLMIMISVSVIAWAD
jgi:hypothetical protein